MQGHLGSSTGMVFEERNVEGDDDSEILQSNDDFEMSHPLPVQSPGTLLKNTANFFHIVVQLVGGRKENLMTLEANFYSWKEQN
jgi:hypothetical protein